MGMGTIPCHGTVISDDDLKKLCPVEYKRLEELLDKVDSSIDGLARDFAMEDGINQDVGHAYADLCVAFEKATKIENGHLTLDLGYYDSENGDRYDELEENHYWDVGGVWQRTPAGEKFSNIVTEKSWTQFG